LSIWLLAAVAQVVALEITAVAAVLEVFAQALVFLLLLVLNTQLPLVLVRRKLLQIMSQEVKEVILFFPQLHPQVVGVVVTTTLIPQRLGVVVEVGPQVAL